MLIVFEVFVAPGRDPDALLSQKVLDETQAQVMTLAEAEAAGLSRARDDLAGREIRLITVAPKDALLVQQQLEASAVVQSFRWQEIEG